MVTKLLKPTIANVKICADEIKNGGVVAFPTETVYGLGANVFNEQAVNKIYIAKGRPNDNPLIVHVATVERIYELSSEVPPLALTLVKEFMPGALTIVLKKKPTVPSCVTAGLDTVAIRMPSHPVARKFLATCGVPVCAPSANTSTRPSPTLAQHVLDDLNGKIPYVLDGGSCDIGVESTIIDLSQTPRILRLGGIGKEQLEKFCGKLEVLREQSVALCPGMKYRHYSPRAEVFLSAYYSHMVNGICKKYDELISVGRNPVILAIKGNVAQYLNRNVKCVGETYQEYAHNLFRLLRECDDEGYNAVIAEGVTGEGIGAAIINRLIKASGGQII